ncbi:B12-binding domain-containing radical SAM protein [Candidatus Altiarchaeota archaeon]
MARILMLNPPWIPGFCRSARWACKSRGRVQRHPDWMLIATAVLEESGHNVTFIDGPAQNSTQEQLERMILKSKPDYTVCHTTTPSIYNDIEHARLAKKLTGCKTILVGPHVTAEPDDTFRIANGAVDTIARGEYDYTLKAIAEGLEFEHVLGLSYIEEGVEKHNADRPLLDINELPFPAWHHIKPEWYWDGGKRYPFLTLISGRGCQGQCTFCRDTNVMYGHKLRLRDPKKVVDEIEHDYELFPHIQEIMFETDTFTADPRHVHDVCQEILDRELKVTWSCNVRVDLDLNLLPLMKEAGCRMLMVGFEFGTQEALDAVRKNITLDQSKRLAEEANRLGFIIHGCFMFGAPGETKKSARETIEFAKSLPLDTVQFSGICTYPGTPLYDWAKIHNHLVPKDWREWISGDYEQVTLLDYPNLHKEEIDWLIDQGLKEFYLRPKHVFKMAKNIRKIGDVKRKLYGLKSFTESNLLRKKY